MILFDPSCWRAFLPNPAEVQEEDDHLEFEMWYAKQPHVDDVDEDGFHLYI